ncbi:polymer-forming cytoskeletal protein [Zunongwangia sp. SCSIO 43204]|uniref:bactofilin family protein n=1 Tax=Zunongwangia sp. SCSIO 43204 TaxID=2779359 RepID=UPI001CAA12E8|nr:polymer-forming cytoskeletal protein [Zunongwangia sp. SCSIO 43204]UAB85298.1 polymer-forming cytoskeletal protein [Zunongwangia sp. SCSIO 43204]
MFSEKKKSSGAKEFSNEQNKIAAGTKITGDITAKGAFRIEGFLKGTLVTTGKVVISKNGNIEGTLECENADIEGSFKGKLKVSGILSLKSTATVDGEVMAGKLAVEPGANFNATCQMRGAMKSVKNEKQSA